MVYLSKKAVSVLIPSLATCGGDVGMLFGTAMAIKQKGEGNLWEIIPEHLIPVARQSLEQLEKEAFGGILTAKSVVRRYGLPEHFHTMREQATDKRIVSVAREIPIHSRAIAHTLLPVKNGVYANEGRIITLKGLVPLGPQKGNLVAHLSGVFASGCSDREIEELLHEQALDPDFLAMADRASIIDYEGTNLQQDTLRAKKALNL
jgi:hypothetical protein